MRLASPGGDLLDDPLDDLLTPCDGTLRTIAFTIRMFRRKPTFAGHGTAG